MKKNILIGGGILWLLLVSFVTAQEEYVQLVDEAQEEMLGQVSTPEILVEDVAEQIPESYEAAIKEVEKNTFLPTLLEESSEPLVEESASSSSSSTLEYQVSDSNTEKNTVRFLIRNGEAILYQGDVEVPAGGSVLEVTDMEGNARSIASNSVLSLLLKADDLSENFSLSKLQYYDSFGSFYLKCIQIQSDELCDNWQYVVDGVSPWTGIDATILEGGEVVGIYFGSSYQVLFSTDIYTVGVPFTAVAQQYEYQTNTWLPRTNVSLGVTMTNPLDIWTPLELLVEKVKEDGSATFTIATSGDYMIGIQEDYYYPSYPIFVGTSTPVSTSTSSGGGSGGGSSKNEFDFDKAYQFLKGVQSSDGSFGNSELYSDWVAVSFGALEKSDSALISYLKSKSNIKNSVTDNQRRVMALLALGKNPYDFEGKDYVSAIVKEFDGTQIGEKNLVNDDIFGLIVLREVGYIQEDLEIEKTISFVLGKQNSNGSWENSVDMTSAAIQALDSFRDVSGVSSAISKAKTYLKGTQQTDGGWGNVYATAWALQAMNVLSESWEKDGNSPEEYLIKYQQADGGLLSSDETERNRIWATSYAIPALLGRSWDEVLESVSKPNTQESVGGGGASSTNTATTTPEVDNSSEEETVGEILGISTTTPALLSKELVRTSTESNEYSQENIQKETAQEVPQTLDSNQEAEADSQVASVQSITWLNEWWGYVLAGVVALLSAWGLSRKFL